MQLIRRSELARRFGMTPVGFSKMAARSAGLPAPIKTGDNRQSAVFYDAAEVEAWIEARKARQIEEVAAEVA